MLIGVPDPEHCDEFGICRQERQIVFPDNRLPRLFPRDGQVEYQLRVELFDALTQDFSELVRNAQPRYK